MKWARLPSIAVGLVLVALASTVEREDARAGSNIKPVTLPLDRDKEVDVRDGAALLTAPVEGMIHVPTTTFVMGSGALEQRVAVEMCRGEPLGGFCSDVQFYEEGMPHAVTLPGYWIDRTEVTVADYQRCVAVGDCPMPSFPSAGPPGDPKHDRPELPVTFVAWDDAEKFCAFRHARLPTEAEWERAARGASGRRFPWGMLPNPRIANHGALDVGAELLPIAGPPTRVEIEQGVEDDIDGYAGLAPVGSFPDGQTPDGIRDLAGNASEWVADYWSDGYDAADVTAPSGPASGAGRVVRGGSYRQPMAMIRSAAREGRLASARAPDLGFRCARSETGS